MSDERAIKIELFKIHLEYLKTVDGTKYRSIAESPEKLMKYYRECFPMSKGEFWDQLK